MDSATTDQDKGDLFVYGHLHPEGEECPDLKKWLVLVPIRLLRA